MDTIIPILHTARLVLRPIVSSDAPEFYRMYQNEGVLQYFPNPAPPSMEKVERFVAYQQTHWEKYGYGNWGIEQLGAPGLMGWAGLQFLQETQETEVGYLLDRSYWGHGYATEVAMASLRFGFERFNLPEIIALVHPDNTASLHVAEKCGLKVVDRKVYWGLELVRHKIKREEYMARKNDAGPAEGKEIH